MEQDSSAVSFESQLEARRRGGSGRGSGNGGNRNSSAANNRVSNSVKQIGARKRKPRWYVLWRQRKREIVLLGIVLAWIVLEMVIVQQLPGHSHTKFPSSTNGGRKLSSKHYNRESRYNSSSLVSWFARGKELWPPILGYTISTNFPLPVNRKDDVACEETPMGHEMCLPFMIGLGCGHCGSNEIAYLLAQQPLLSWGSQQAHDFFTRDDFSHKTEFFVQDSLVTYIYMREFTFSPRTSTLGFDWSPEYFGRAGDMYDVPGRIKALLPNAKFVVVLRDPMDPITWDELLPQELRYYLGNRNESEIASSIECTWARRLRYWLEIFPRDRFFFVRYEDVAGEVWRRARLMAEISFFLGLPTHKYHVNLLNHDYRSNVGANSSWWRSHHRRYSSLSGTTMPNFAQRCRDDLTLILGRNMWPDHTKALAERDMELRRNSTHLISFPTDPENMAAQQRRKEWENKYGSRPNIDLSFRHPAQSGVLKEISRRAGVRSILEGKAASATISETHGPQHHQGHIPRAETHKERNGHRLDRNTLEKHRRGQRGLRKSRRRARS
jgi:hypothetical protein